MKRKILAGILSVCMMVSLFPTAAFAEEVVVDAATPVVTATSAEEQPDNTAGKTEEPVEEPVIAGETAVVTSEAADEAAGAATASVGTLSSSQINMSDADETFISAEITGLNATESVVIKLYSGEEQIATTTLQNSGYLTTSPLSVKIIITGASSSWKTVWAEGLPRADFVPDKMVLYVDGQEMNSATVNMVTTNGETAVNWAAVPGVKPVPVAKIGETSYGTLAEALTAAVDGDKIELIWAEGNDPIAMNGAVYGNKTVTITGEAQVDWGKGFLFVGRGGEGNGKVIFEYAKLTSASNSASYGIHVSGREKNTTNKYDGTLEIKNSKIELDYLINKGVMTIDNSILTVKNGFSIGGRPASETESGADATATITLNNDSTVVVNNHNGMGIGYEAIGVMNVNDGCTFECTQNFLVTAKGTLNNKGTVKVAGTLKNEGTLISSGDITATITKAENAVIEISAGTYTQDVSGWLAEGTYIAKVDDKWVVDKVENPITCEEELKAAIKAGKTEIKLGASFEAEDITINKDITLDLGGKKLTGNIYVKEGADVTIKNGEIVNTDNDVSAIEVCDDSAENKLTLENVIIDSARHAVRVEAGELVINSGEYTVTSPEDKETSNHVINLGTPSGLAVKATINGGTFTGLADKDTTENIDDGAALNVQETATVTVNGGTFTGGQNNTLAEKVENAITVYGGEFDQNPSEFLASNYEAVASGSNYVVGEHKLVKVAQVNATCKDTGTKAYYKCKTCGKIYSDAAGQNEITDVSTLVIPKTSSHKYGDWERITNPTCTEKGQDKHTCSVCGKVEYCDVPATGHNYGTDGKCLNGCGAYDASKDTTSTTTATTTTTTTTPATTPSTEETTETPVENATPTTANTSAVTETASEAVVEAVGAVTVTEGTATVSSDVVSAVVEATGDGSTVVLPLTQTTDSVVNKAEVPTEALSTVAEAEKDVVVELTDGKVKLDANAIAAIAEQAEGEDVGVSVVKGDVNALTEAQKASLADKETAAIISAQVVSNGKQIKNLNGGEATIVLPFEAEAGKNAADYAVYQIGENGELTKVAAEIVDGHMVLTAGSISDYAIVYEGTAAEEVVTPEADTETDTTGASVPVMPIIIAVVVIGGILFFILAKRRKDEDEE